MDMHVGDGAVRVTLSERNVKDLAAQLEDGSFPYASLFRVTPNGLLVVDVQSDEAHYGDRSPGRGSGLVF